MNKILVIFTGGTIGSSVRNGVISPDESAAADLIEAYERDYGGDVTFTCLAPFTILSENVTSAELTQLCRVVDENHDKGYKGIIITYGSDTLSYATALLGTAFQDRLECPVVFAAANKPLADPESNGYDDFAGAVWLIDLLSKSGAYNDVYAVWHSGSVFGASRGVELTEADAGSHNHGVFGGVPFAEFYPEEPNATGTGYKWRVVMSDKHENRCESPLAPAKLEYFKELGFKLFDDIIAVRAYPGIQFNRILLAHARAVLVYGFHSGTFPAVGEGGNFHVFARNLRDLGIRLYAASFKKDEPVVYESVKELESNIIRLEDMSFEAAYANVLISEACITDII